MVRHQAALAAGSEPALTSGGNLPPLEVFMSRRVAEHSEKEVEISM